MKTKQYSSPRSAWGRPFHSSAVRGDCFDAVPHRGAVEKPCDAERRTRPSFLFLSCLLCISWFPSPCLSQSITVDSTLLTLVEQVEVPAREAGVLKSVLVHEGNLVKDGTVLALIDETQVQLTKTNAEIELENARELARNDVKIRFAKKSQQLAQSDLERALESRRKFASSVSDTEVAHLKLAVEKAALEIEQAEYDQRQAKQASRLRENELAIANHKVDRHQIVSPIAGVVVEINRHRGEWVEPGQKVLRILRIDPLRAEGFVLVSELKDGVSGSSVTFRLKGDDTPYAGRLVFVSPEVNPVNGQVRVWAEIDNPRLKLRPGLRGAMSIERK